MNNHLGHLKNEDNFKKIKKYIVLPQGVLLGLLGATKNTIFGI
jgi:hypothetical protein